MTELEKIEYAKSFIDKLANGVNPIDNNVIPDGEIINNVRISRCFFYVSDILRQVIENGGISRSENLKASEKKSKKHPYYFMPEHAGRFEYSDTPITSTEIINRIVAVGPQEGVKKFPKKNFSKWLVSLGLLEVVSVNGKAFKNPTQNGEEMGISLEERWGQHGRYYVVLYSKEAQQFIIDNIEAILAFDDKINNSESSLDENSKDGRNGNATSMSQKRDNKEGNASTIECAEIVTDTSLKENDIVTDASVKTEVSEYKNTNIKNHISILDGSATQEVSCHNCRFARSGDCFPQKEICADYERAFNISQDEREAWPDMGDASYFRQKGIYR